MRNRLLIILFCLITNTLLAQISANRWGIHSAGLGGIVSVVEDPLGSAANWADWNPRNSKRFSNVGITLALEPTLKTSTQVFSLIPISKHNTLGVNYQYYGSSTYNEQEATLGYGLRTGRNAALGLSLHYLHSGTEDAHYSPIDILTFSASGIWIIGRKAKIGAHIFNPFSVSFNEDAFLNLPSQYRLGVSYKLSSNLNSLAEIEAINFQRARMHCGLEYNWLETIDSRIGLATNPIEYSFGLGYNNKQLSINLAFLSNLYRGYSSMLSFSYQL